MRLPRLSSASIVRLALFIISFTLAILVKKIYRPWVYQRGMDFLYLTDWGPSLFYIFGFMMLAALTFVVSSRGCHLKFPTMAGIAIGAIVYEISHAFRSDRWFSWDDLGATVAGGLMAFLVEWILEKFERRVDLKRSGGSSLKE